MGARQKHCTRFPGDGRLKVPAEDRQSEEGDRKPDGDLINEELRAAPLDSNRSTGTAESGGETGSPALEQDRECHESADEHVEEFHWVHCTAGGGHGTMLLTEFLWVVSSVGLERLVYTQKVAGSTPAPPTMNEDLTRLLKLFIVSSFVFLLRRILMSTITARIRTLTVLSAGLCLMLALHTGIVPQPTNVASAATEDTVKNRVRISVTDGQTFADPQDVLTYRILVTNRENIPRSIDVRAQTPSQFIIHEITGPHRKDGRKIEWYNLEFEPQETREFFVTGHVERSVPEYFPMRFTVSSGQERAVDTTTISAEGKDYGSLVVSLSNGQQSARPGQILEYVVVLENTSSTLLTNMEVQASLPPYTEFVDAVDGGEWLGGGIFWEGLTVSPLGRRMLHYVVRVRSDAPLGGTIRAGVNVMGRTEAYDNTNIATVATGTPDSAAGRDAVLRKQADRREVRPGDTVLFTVMLRNTTDRAFRNVTITDQFDAQYLRLAETVPGAQMSAGSIMWNIGTLEPGGEWMVRYRMQVHPQAPHSLQIKNAVTATGEGMETVSLTERIVTGTVGVITSMPKSGASLDALFLLLAGLLSIATAGAQARRQAMVAFM